MLLSLYNISLLQESLFLKVVVLLGMFLVVTHTKLVQSLMLWTLQCIIVISSFSQLYSILVIQDSFMYLMISLLLKIQNLCWVFAVMQPLFFISFYLPSILANLSPLQGMLNVTMNSVNGRSIVLYRVCWIFILIPNHSKEDICLSKEIFKVTVDVI